MKRRRRRARRRLAAILAVLLIMVGGGIMTISARHHAGRVDPHVHSAVYHRPTSHPTYRA